MSNCQERKALLDQAGSRFFQVEFVKKNGERRLMTCKKWVESAYSNGSKNAQKSTLANKPEYYLAVDVEKGEFRAINLNTLTSAKINGKMYYFN